MTLSVINVNKQSELDMYKKNIQKIKYKTRCVTMGLSEFAAAERFS